MKLIFLASILLASQGGDPKLFGNWKYVAYTYGGQTHPLPNPNLDLHLSFQEDGISKLQWHYVGEGVSCERDAQYEIQSDGTLYQKIIWVNPSNHLSCAQDTDMQLGRESYTHYTVKAQRLTLDLSLAGELFQYEMDKVEKKVE